MLVKPKNNAENVKKFFDLFSERALEINPDVVVKVGEISADMPVPFALQKPIKLNILANQYWDLNVSIIYKFCVYLEWKVF